MKLRKIFLFLTILFAAFQISFGQEKPVAVLLDQFGRITCEDLLARLDQFSTDLNNNPDSTGYIVIHPEKDSFKKAIPYVTWIKGHWTFRKLDETRFVIIKGEEKDLLDIEFWRLPTGADESFYKGEKWIAESAKVKKAFLFTSLNTESICPTFNPKDFAALLLSDTSLRGHIVIISNSQKVSQKTAQEWLSRLTQQYKVPRNRLKVFFVKRKDAFDAEFWIVPTKKK